MNGKCAPQTVCGCSFMEPSGCLAKKTVKEI